MKIKLRKIIGQGNKKQKDYASCYYAILNLELYTRLYILQSKQTERVKNTKKKEKKKTQEISIIIRTRISHGHFFLCNQSFNC